MCHICKELNKNKVIKLLQSTECYFYFDPKQQDLKTGKQFNFSSWASAARRQIVGDGGSPTIKNRRRQAHSS